MMMMMIMMMMPRHASKTGLTKDSQGSHRQTVGGPPSACPMASVVYASNEINL